MGLFEEASGEESARLDPTYRVRILQIRPCDHWSTSHRESLSADRARSSNCRWVTVQAPTVGDQNLRSEMFLWRTTLLPLVKLWETVTR